MAALAVIPLCIGVLAGCSAGDQQSEQPPAGQEQTLEDWQVGFASCMRGEGIDIPDSGTITSGPDTDREAMDAATKTCIERLGDPPAGTGNAKTDEESLAEALKAAQCFRDRGYDAPDPKPNEAIGLPAGASQEDIRECAGKAAGSVTSRR